MCSRYFLIDVHMCAKLFTFYTYIHKYIHICIINLWLGFIEAFRQEEESFERRRKVKLERREKALRQLEREKTSAATPVSGSTIPPMQPTPLPRLPSITKPSMSIVQRWGYVLPTITSNPLFRGGMAVGTRYGFAMVRISCKHTLLNAYITR